MKIGSESGRHIGLKLVTNFKYFFTVFRMKNGSELGWSFG